SYVVLSTAMSNTENSGDIVNVQSQAPDLWTIIAAGAGGIVNIGNSSHTLNAIQGDLLIEGGKPSVNFDDSGDASPRSVNMGGDGINGYLVTYLLPASNLGRGRVWLQLDPAAQVSINTGTADDPFVVHDLTNAPAFTLIGGGGNNSLQGPNSISTWQISG